ncbi:endonuclease/exonuclease/phosphatase family protein [Sphaerisporangium aureirubrum]|uniref:Endonuclease/exonuclease/phosphatase family protein n=1 Tax=Sphaerisporangium aureirubrum TaxID=1544736 RepID=A0ABW1NAI2_9ACTN
MELVERAATDSTFLSAYVRVGTWNVNEATAVRSGVDPFLEILHLVREQRLDLLAMQEVPFPDCSDVSPLFQRLLGETQLSYMAGHNLSPSYVRPGGRSGVAIASRFPFDEVTRAVFPNPQLVSEGIYSFDKGTVTIRISLGGRKITLGSVHLFPFHRFHRRAEEPEFSAIWDHLAKEVEQYDDEVVVFAGDFNTEQRDLVLRRLEGPLQSALPGGRVDDVLFGGARLVTVTTVPTFSDHPLCIAELDLTSAREAAA